MFCVSCIVLSMMKTTRPLATGEKKAWPSRKCEEKRGGRGGGNDPQSADENFVFVTRNEYR